MSVGVGVRGQVRSQPKMRGNVAYESILRTYTQDLKPRMTRKLGRVAYRSPEDIAAALSLLRHLVCSCGPGFRPVVW